MIDNEITSMPARSIRTSVSPTIRQNILPGDGKTDFLFIDGDHTYQGVKADFEMYAPLVRPGGLVVFHDICKHAEAMDCHVDRFWQEIKNERQTREFVDNRDQGTCGIGVIEL